MTSIQNSSVVVVPTANRPELLALTLQRLSVALARASKPTDVNIYVDHLGAAAAGRLDEVEYVRDNYLPEATIFRSRPHVAAPSGCFNILHAIKSAYDLGAQNIYLVEEDVQVKPHYFEHHERALESYDVSFGRRNPSYGPRYEGIYTNPGSAFRREFVERLAPHINDSYFQELRTYLDRELPPSWDEMSELDDGLIRRVIREYGFTTLEPEVPSCAHKGFHFYNRVDLYMNNEGSIEERIARARHILSAVKPGDRYARDYEEG